MKICKKCGKEKLLTEFFDHKTNKDGKSGSCKICATEAKKERRRLYGHEPRGNYKRSKIQNRVRQLKLYNLSLDDFQEILELQDHKCAICGDPFLEEMPRIDHCHQTGVVRGLLHNKCNIALGLFSDDIQTLRNAIMYLEKQTPRSGLHH